jgi:hypothetical protein
MSLSSEVIIMMITLSASQQASTPAEQQPELLGRSLIKYAGYAAWGTFHGTRTMNFSWIGSLN